MIESVYNEMLLIWKTVHPKLKFNLVKDVIVLSLSAITLQEFQ